MVKEFKVVGKLLEFNCFSHEYGQSVTMVYKAVILDGQAEQQLTITDASGEILERRIIGEPEHVLLVQIATMKTIQRMEESQ